MNRKPLHPTLRLALSGILSLVVLNLALTPGGDPRWLIVLGGVATAALVLLIPVLVRGDSWQKMVAGLLLFVPSFGLIMAVMGVVGSL